MSDRVHGDGSPWIVLANSSRHVPDDRYSLKVVREGGFVSGSATAAYA